MSNEPKLRSMPFPSSLQIRIGTEHSITTLRHNVGSFGGYIHDPSIAETLCGLMPRASASLPVVTVIIGGFGPGRSALSDEKFAESSNCGDVNRAVGPQC